MQAHGALCAATASASRFWTTSDSSSHGRVWPAAPSARRNPR